MESKCPRCENESGWDVLGCHDTGSNGDEITGQDVAFNVYLCRCGCLQIEDVWSKSGVTFVFQGEIILREDKQ
ncbi:MAG: hypothetical protein ACRDC6_05025 [Shewanella sp.]